MQTPAAALLLALALVAPAFSQPADPNAAPPDCGPGCGGGDEFSDERYQVPLNQLSGSMKRDRMNRAIDESRSKLDQMERILRFQRTIELVEIHKAEGNYRGEQLDPNNGGGRIESELENKVVGGSRFKGGDLVDPGFAARSKILTAAREKLDRLRTMDADRDSQEAEKLHASMSRDMNLAYLGDRVYQLKRKQADLAEIKDRIAAAEAKVGLNGRLQHEHARLSERLRSTADSLQRLVSQSRSIKDVLETRTGKAANVNADDAIADSVTFHALIYSVEAVKNPSQDPNLEKAAKDIASGDYPSARARLKK